MPYVPQGAKWLEFRTAGLGRASGKHYIKIETSVYVCSKRRLLSKEYLLLKEDKKQLERKGLANKENDPLSDEASYKPKFPGNYLDLGWESVLLKSHGVFMAVVFQSNASQI